MQYFIEGLLTAAVLIIPLGAQNAFVLKQGLLRAHVLIIVLICAFSDALLFLLGVMGVGALVNNNVFLLYVLAFSGIAFLTAYGAFSAWQAWRGGKVMEIGSGAGPGSLAKTVAATLAITYLNPHVYLDTVVIFGGLSAPLPWSIKWMFWAGASTSSMIWFFGLGYGARLLGPLFQNPRVWRILDACIALIMWWIAAGLALFVLSL